MLDEVGVKEARSSLRDSGVQAEALCPLVLNDCQIQEDQNAQRLNCLLYTSDAADE